MQRGFSNQTYRFLTRRGLVIFACAVFGFLVLYIALTSQKVTKQADHKAKSINLFGSALPLHPAFAWLEPQTYEFAEYRDGPEFDVVPLAGYLVSSQEITGRDAEKLLLENSIPEYYRQRLTDLFWDQDIYFAADGVSGSFWAYRNGRRRVIFNLRHQLSGTTDEGLPSCPCTMQLEIFWGVPKPMMAAVTATTAKELEQWVVYENQAYGIRFRHPVGWYVYENEAYDYSLDADWSLNLAKNGADAQSWYIAGSVKPIDEYLRDRQNADQQNFILIKESLRFGVTVKKVLVFDEVVDGYGSYYVLADPCDNARTLIISSEDGWLIGDYQDETVLRNKIVAGVLETLEFLR